MVELEQKQRRGWCSGRQPEVEADAVTVAVAAPERSNREGMTHKAAVLLGRSFRR